jgi:hypothetical protein
MCLRVPALASTSSQCEIGLPYFLSMDGKYEAGPVTFLGVDITLTSFAER